MRTLLQASSINSRKLYYIANICILMLLAASSLYLVRLFEVQTILANKKAPENEPQSTTTSYTTTSITQIYPKRENANVVIKAEIVKGKGGAAHFANLNRDNNHKFTGFLIATNNRNSINHTIFILLLMQHETSQYTFNENSQHFAINKIDGHYARAYRMPVMDVVVPSVHQEIHTEQCITPYELGDFNRIDSDKLKDATCRSGVIGRMLL